MFTSVQACWDVYVASIKEESSDKPEFDQTGCKKQKIGESNNGSVNLGSGLQSPQISSSIQSSISKSPKSRGKISPKIGGETEEDSDSLEVRSRRNTKSLKSHVIQTNPSTESSTESGSDEDLPGFYTSAPPLQEHLGDEPDLYQDSSESSADSETEQAEPSVALSVISTKDSSFVSESDKCSPSSFNPSGRTDDVSSGFGSDEVEEKKEKISNHTFSNEYDIPEEVDEDSHTSSDPTPSQPEVNEPAGGETDEDSDEDSLEVRSRRNLQSSNFLLRENFN